VNDTPPNSKHDPEHESEQVLILRDEVHYRAIPEGEPLEGEVLPQAGEQFDAATRRISKPFNTLWWVSLVMTVWLVWLTLRGDPTGIMNVLLALILALPFLVLSAARLALAGVFALLRDGVQQAHAMPKNAQQWQDTMRNAREHAGKARASEWMGAAGKVSDTVDGVRTAAQALMLTPGFFAALALSLLATLIMLPVTLFTLLLVVF
jgi:hypothetical protein